MEPSSLSVEDQFTLFRDAQPTVYRKVIKVRQDWGTLGGERAGYLEVRRTKPDGTKENAWNVVTVRRSVPYVIDCQSPQDEVDRFRKDVQGLLSSFRWVEEAK